MNKNYKRKIVTRSRIRIRIHPGPGSGSTISKGGSEDPDPDPLFPKGGSEDPDPDPLYPTVDPKIRIHVKMKWIRNYAGAILLRTHPFHNHPPFRIPPLLDQH